VGPGRSYIGSRRGLGASASDHGAAAGTMVAATVAPDVILVFRGVGVASVVRAVHGCVFLSAVPSLHSSLAASLSAGSGEHADKKVDAEAVGGDCGGGGGGGPAAMAATIAPLPLNEALDSCEAAGLALEQPPRAALSLAVCARMPPSEAAVDAVLRFCYSGDPTLLLAPAATAEKVRVQRTYVTEVQALGAALGLDGLVSWCGNILEDLGHPTTAAVNERSSNTRF